MKPLYMLALHRARYGCTCCKRCFKGSGWESLGRNTKAKTKKVYTQVARARLRAELRAMDALEDYEHTLDCVPWWNDWDEDSVPMDSHPLKVAFIEIVRVM